MLALRFWLIMALAGAVASPPVMAIATPRDCGDLLPSSAVQPRRPITVQDLARLRDVGTVDFGLGSPSPIGVSPDGGAIAFLLSRADPDRNDYCRGMVVVSLAGRSAPRLIDRGGGFLPMTQVQRGLVTELGVNAVIAPRWSRDGRFVAYLRRDGGGVPQLWLAAADGRTARALTSSLDAVEAFAWSPDGTALILQSRPDLHRMAEQRSDEARRGYLFDDRFVPLAGATPRIRGPQPAVYHRLDLAKGRVGPASTADVAVIDPDMGPNLRAVIAAASADQRAWLTPDLPGGLYSPVSLFGRDEQGKVWRCTSPLCTRERFLGLWWPDGSRSLWFLRREGAAGSSTALYRWVPGRDAPHLVYRDSGPLSGCAVARHELVCLQESSLQPRQIVAIDMEEGRRRIVFDPNPEFAFLETGTVRRLFWRNALGLDAFGDLVLPPGHRTGTKLPMIVVQYDSRGFLRGGTGDEVPILPLAARGFAVLSIQMPASFDSLFPPGTWRDYAEAEVANVRNWSERRSVAGSLVTGVERALATGQIDRDRLGLTGLSDGSTTAWYLLINTDLFAATAVSTCCADPKTDAVLVGPAWEADRERSGYPSPLDDRPSFWAPVSPSINASKFRGPILLQLSDDEYQRSLEAYAAFRRIGPPTEMYVFPGEHHVKWQPAHRLAIYQRNIDWFEYWLKGISDPDPARQEQYQRWRALAAQALARGWVPPVGHKASQASASTSRRIDE